MAGCWAAEHGGHFNLWWTGKSMLCCFILFKRCRTCRSQLRCWTYGRRGTFSISWGWRARSKDFGQSSGRLNRTGRRSSTKTFRYIFVWSLTCGEPSQWKAAGKIRSTRDKNKHSWNNYKTTSVNKTVEKKRKATKWIFIVYLVGFFLNKQKLGINWPFELYCKETSTVEGRYKQCRI